MIEKTNRATADPKADTAIVPFRPNLVSIIQDAIYETKGGPHD
jgi:hypothetical protein